MLPKRLTIELTNRCNRFCVGCPRHQMRYPIGDINENLWVQILNQLPNETAIVPFFRGEPTLHPKFNELLQTLDRFTTVQLATNGDHLTHTNKRAILENVTYLSLSIHKFTLPVESTWLPFMHCQYSKRKVITYLICPGSEWLIKGIYWNDKKRK